jgi:hypothetical protein
MLASPFFAAGRGNMRAILPPCSLLVLLATVAWAADPPAGASKETAADVAARALLEVLEERQMPDVTLAVLARVEADPEASAELKREAAFRRAGALIGVSRAEADSGKRPSRPTGPAPTARRSRRRR